MDNSTRKIFSSVIPDAGNILLHLIDVAYRMKSIPLTKQQMKTTAIPCLNETVTTETKT